MSKHARLPASLPAGTKLLILRTCPPACLCSPRGSVLLHTCCQCALPCPSRNPVLLDITKPDPQAIGRAPQNSPLLPCLLLTTSCLLCLLCWRRRPPHRNAGDLPEPDRQASSRAARQAQLEGKGGLRYCPTGWPAMRLPMGLQGGAFNAEAGKACERIMHCSSLHHLLA